MDALEDDNPFDQDGDNITSETSSTSKLDLSEPPSPPLHAPEPPPSSPLSRPFPSQGSHRQPQMSFKSDFCCTRDRVLHSGEDVEILVRNPLIFPSNFDVLLLQRSQMRRRLPYIQLLHILPMLSELGYNIVHDHHSKC